ncbi:unnamed protein product [Rotaria magnacalcarata]|nr:unnamed protein product [Rotaria magnacalcarata]CAF5190346.1 unnamed protein product [Rotaria magnacalcarata]
MADLDKHGQACTIFTVIIHPDFYRRAHSSPTFMNFLLTLMYEGLESKYPQFKLDTEASIPMSLKKNTHKEIKNAE